MPQSTHRLVSTVHLSLAQREQDAMHETAGDEDALDPDSLDEGLAHALDDELDVETEHMDHVSAPLSPCNFTKLNPAPSLPRASVVDSRARAERLTG